MVTVPYEIHTAHKNAHASGNYKFPQKSCSLCTQLALMLAQKRVPLFQIYSQTHQLVLL